MKDFKQYKLSDLYSIDSGISISKDQSGFGYPFLSFKTVFNNYFLPPTLQDYMNTTEAQQKKYSIKQGDIFLTRTSETNDELAMSSVALKDYPTATYSGFLKRLRPKNNEVVYEKYIAFYLRNIFFRKTINNYTSLTLRASFNEELFSYLNVYLPPYKTQKTIGDLLFLFENKISINNSIISKLEEMAKMIYEYWFLQFDFPNHEGKSYASSGGAMKYSEELGREIPTDWEVENFYKNSLFSLVPTGVEKFSTKRYLATADVVGTNIGEGKQVEYETRETRANMQPRINSVWFAKMKNSTKHLFLNKEMGFLIEKCILSTGFFGLQCSETSFEYIASTISYPSFEIKKDSLAHGATQEAVNQDDLQSIKLLIPNTFVLEKFHELTKPLYGYISQMRHENQKLTQLRDWLLPMLMNGQVRVE